MSDDDSPSGRTQKLVDDATPTSLLRERSLAAVAEYILSGRAKRLAVMVGAGISTAAGIPDFRSPDTGLIAQMAKKGLDFDNLSNMAFFRKDPSLFYASAQRIYPGRYQPTFTHYFLRVMHDHGYLYKLFTQNTDTLESIAGIPPERVIHAHGSWASQRCIDCQKEHPHNLMKEAVDQKKIPLCQDCKGYVKPDIVFFGERLPQRFIEEMEYMEDIDFCIVMGTSLKVFPFGGLPDEVDLESPRVLINRELAGNLGTCPDDVVYLGSCDDGAYILAKELGWLEEVEKLYGRPFVPSLQANQTSLQTSNSALEPL